MLVIKGYKKVVKIHEFIMLKNETSQQRLSISGCLNSSHFDCGVVSQGYTL